MESAEDESDGYEYVNTPSRMNGNSSPRGKTGEMNGVDPLQSSRMDADGNEILADGQCFYWVPRVVACRIVSFLCDQNVLHYLGR